MSITSSRTIQVGFSGDISAQIIQSALDNAVSPAEPQIISLISGNNSVTPPSITGLVVTGVTIIPPPGNTVVITMKGANGDTGIPLHVTDPSSIALDTGFSSLVLSAGAPVIGLRLIWT